MRRLPTLALLAGAAVAGVAGLRHVLARDDARGADERVVVSDGAPPRDLSGAPVPLPRRVDVRVVGPAHVAPPAWEPPALTALARWEPLAPATPLGRALAYAWAAPLTLAGLLLGAISGARPQVRDGIVVFASVAGLPGAVLQRRRFAAAAIGHAVLCLREPTDALLAHELVHVRHAERLGPLSALAYLGLLAVYGYARHPFERAARTAQRRALTGRT